MRSFGDRRFIPPKTVSCRTNGAVTAARPARRSNDRRVIEHFIFELPNKAFGGFVPNANNTGTGGSHGPANRKYLVKLYWATTTKADVGVVPVFNISDILSMEPDRGDADDRARRIGTTTDPAILSIEGYSTVDGS